MKDLKLKIKRFIYRTCVALLRLYWGAVGRKASVFGQSINLLPKTVFPSFWNLRLPTGDAHSQIVRYGDFVQMHSMVTYVAQLKHPAVIIDVGAHHGAYAIVLGKILQKMGVGGKIIAVEPNPHSFSVLEKNVRLNGLEDTVYCERVAVSDQAGTMNISINDVQSRISNQATSGSVPADVVTLSMLMEKYKIDHVDVLQIDVEGAELLVLKGFPWETKKVGKIYCELHPYAWPDFGYGGSEFRNYLIDRNFRCFDMYLHEHFDFTDTGYIGPTLFVSRDVALHQMQCSIN